MKFVHLSSTGIAVVSLVVAACSSGGGEPTNQFASTASALDAADLDARVLNLTPERFFPEGVTVDNSGNFYMGSMFYGSIYTGKADSGTAVPLIDAGAHGLVSVIGVYADDAHNTLWVCSSDAGNAQLSGTAPVAIKAFELLDSSGNPSGAFKASYDWPAPSNPPIPGASLNGFCNDMTVDAAGNLYATDSWYPRILRLPVGGSALEEWVNSPVFPQDQWHLNGLDIDQSNNTLYVVENHPGALYSIPIQADGSAGAVTELTTSRPILSPDGLKVLAPNVLVTAEGANNGGGVSIVKIDGASATIEEVVSGFDQVATLALHQGSAWVVENQADHFWNPAGAGPDADPPFRLVEVPLDTGAGAGVITIDTERFFPEGSTVDAAGNFYIGSMDLGSIVKVPAGTTTPASFIEPSMENGLVSVLGLYADDARNTLWACSSDAGNGQLAGSAPVALKAFDMTTGALTGSWDWPAARKPIAGAPVNGFCNDITVDDDGNVYATDSWYPRILVLKNGRNKLKEWVYDKKVFPQTQWHLNGIDIDEDAGILYAVENHPGTLYAVDMMPNGNAGSVSVVDTSRPLLSPDGLKVVAEGMLAAAEGQHGSIVLIDVDSGLVRRFSTGLDGIATFALLDGSAWLVENQADHFWNPGGAGPDASKPFRLVEVPLGL